MPTIRHRLRPTTAGDHGRRRTRDTVAASTERSAASCERNDVRMVHLGW